jgi:DNA helicase-2/ATP-dependent DNA helicase PcrA
MTLTVEQQAAVDFDGNLLLTACPGSGKTRVITVRLISEIEKVRGTAKAVACITYTNAAVEEIERRIHAYILEGDDKHYCISTIHSFCLTQVLRPYAWLVPGFVGSMRVITRDRPEFEDIARYAAAQVNLHNLTARDFEAFSSLSLDAAGRLIGAALQNEAVRRAAPHFWRRCEELGFFDFANIVYKSYCLLRDHPLIAQTLSARFAYFLIDEFQDTTELQTEILKLVHARGLSQFFLVGDPAQSIFGFTGARPELLEPFAEDIGANRDLSLSGNFRSSPPIVNHAELLYPRDPEMHAVGRNRQRADAPEYFRVTDTLEAITDEFLPRLQELGIPLGEAAILAREWAPLFPISRALRDLGVPVVGPGARPYRRSRLFASLAEQLCGYIVDPGSQNIRQLERALFHAVQDVTGHARLDIFTYEGRVTLVQLLREASRLGQHPGAVHWLDNMSQSTGDILTRNGFIDAQQAGLFYASVQEMKADMRGQGVDIANLTVEDLGLFAVPSRALRLMTIHNAKGREFGGVAIINLREGKFPSYYAQTPDAIEGEKRLFYVAVTRAERFLMYVSERDNWNNPPCRFLGRDGVGILG